MHDFGLDQVAAPPQEGKCASHIFRRNIGSGLDFRPLGTLDLRDLDFRPAMHALIESAPDETPALKPNAAIGPALRAIAGSILAKARLALTDPQRSNQDAVHDFRRAMKQWRAPPTPPPPLLPPPRPCGAARRA